MNFELDARLAGDTYLIGDFSLSRALLMNDARYVWVILVPRLESVTELYQLNQDDYAQFCNESKYVSEYLVSHFEGDKLNIAALGNVVSQLHVHHVLRSKDDPAWPCPVWGHSQAVPYSSEKAESLVQQFIADWNLR